MLVALGGPTQQMNLTQGFQIALVFAGFWVLAKAADRLVLITLSLGCALRMSPAVAGVTIAAPGTSAPELGTALVDILGDNSGGGAIGVGTVLGSAAFNLAAVVGVVALVSRGAVGRRIVLRECGCYCLAVLALLVCAYLGAPEQPGISIVEGLCLVGLYGVYVALVLTWFKSKAGPVEGADEHLPPLRAGFELVALVLIIGAACHVLVVGTRTGAILLGSWLQVSPSVLATLLSLVVLAVGTSLPDLLASVSAARRGQVGMAVSNAVASNTFDILVCLGLPYALIGGAEVAPSTINISVVLLGLAVLVTLLLVWRDPPRKLGGSALVGLYAAFVGASIAVSL